MDNTYSENDTLNFNESYIFERYGFENVGNNSISNTKDTEKRAIDKKDIFKTEKEFIKKKRGKKGEKGKKRQTHTKAAFDNIITKVQVHFMSFIIFFLNECVSNLSTYKKIEFLIFAHELKSNSTNKLLQVIKNYKLKDLLEKWNISKKNKKYDKDINKTNLKKLRKEPLFEDIFRMEYLELFSLYYNDEQPLEEISINSKQVKLSDKSKSFYGLLKNNEDLKEDIIKYTQMVYPIEERKCLDKKDGFIRIIKPPKN